MAEHPARPARPFCHNAHIRTIRIRHVVGLVLCVVGAVWIGQGVGIIGGSFMSGEAVWAVIGAVALLFGAALLRPRR